MSEGWKFCVHGKHIYESVTGTRHVAAEGGDLCKEPQTSEIGTGYMRRNLDWVGHGILDDGTPRWEYLKWNDLLSGFAVPHSLKEAQNVINMLNKRAKATTGQWQYSLLRCSSCGCYHNQSSWVGIECDSCKEKNDVPKKKPFPLISSSQLAGAIGMKPKPFLIRTEGEIWKLPKSTSPMWTEQWGYQGSSKTPYIISRNPTKVDGSTTGDGWACSCPNFTRHTPRTPCKHILNVKLKEGYVDLQTKGSAKLANVDDAKLKAFEAWEREQAAAKKSGPADKAKLNLFGATGRKFR